MESSSGKLNVGRVDRILRIVLGLALTLMVMTGQIGAWGWFGLILLVTGLMRFCPLYTLLGVNTQPPKKK